MTEARMRQSLTLAMLGLMALAACRRGTIGGTGAFCDDDHACRAGYRCQTSGCVPAQAEDAPHADGPPVRQPPDAPSAGDDAGTDGLVAPDATPDLRPPDPPSLQRCAELAYDGKPTACTPPGPL